MPALSRLDSMIMPLGSASSEEAASHIGKALTVTGRLDTSGVIRIDGTIIGQITADRLVLGVGGHIEGDVVAKTVQIGGRFKGRIFAPHVTVDASAEINGRIFHHAVTVAKGARVEGRMPWRPLNYFEKLEPLGETES